MAVRRATGPASPLLLPALLLVLAAPAEAGTATATLTVTANVRSGCSIENGSLDFGDYTAGQSADLLGSGTIRIRNCPGTVTIELDGGRSGNVRNRQLASGADRLNYQLFKDTARQQVWGTGADAFTMQILQSDAPIQVFGRIPGGQRVPAGTYSDSVTITMTF
jgi:spore coat protein U-like protein